MRQLLSHLKINLGVAASLISFRKLQVWMLDTRPEQIFALALLNVFAWFCTDRLSIQGDALFSIWGLHSHVVVIALSLLGAWLVSSFAGDRLHFPSTAVLSLGGLAYVSIAYALVTRGFMSIDAPKFLWQATNVVFAAWIPAAMFRVVGATSTLSWKQTSLISLGIVALTAGIVSHLPQSSFWYPDSAHAETKTNTDYVNVETTFYNQHLLLDEHTQSIREGVPGVGEYFFVGFGSYASQDVFSREIQSVRKLFDTRFDTQDRSIALINNRKTADDTPIASVSNLRIVVNRVAQKMNVDEDVLFLYLTSHGTPDHTLAVDFYPLNLNQLSPVTLANVLDNSGIKYRVVVVSACYSGGYVEALQNSNTLVITASAADRVSFGCQHENEYTWFGEAFFDEALRQTRSIPEAFDMAKKQIKIRELTHEFEPSLPQIASGEQIEAKLNALTAQSELAQKDSAASATLSSSTSTDDL